MQLLDLLKAAPDAIGSALLGRSFFLVEEGDFACRIVSDDLLVLIAWDYRDRQMSSSIKPCEAPEIFLQGNAEVETTLWLRPTQQDVPERPSGPLSASLLDFELSLIGEVVSKVFSHSANVRDGLIYAFGFYDGYTQRGLDYSRVARRST